MAVRQVWESKSTLIIPLQNFIVKRFDKALPGEKKLRGVKRKVCSEITNRISKSIFTSSMPMRPLSNKNERGPSHSFPSSENPHRKRETKSQELSTSERPSELIATVKDLELSLPQGKEKWTQNTGSRRNNDIMLCADDIYY